VKILKQGPLGPKNYPPILKSAYHDDILVRFIDEHLCDEQATCAQVVAEHARLWYVLTITKDDNNHVKIRVPL
jgi:hypothetical protein